MSSRARRRDYEITQRMARRPLEAVGQHMEGEHCRTCGYVVCNCNARDFILTLENPVRLLNCYIVTPEEYVGELPARQELTSMQDPGRVWCPSFAGDDDAKFMGGLFKRLTEKRVTELRNDRAAAVSPVLTACDRAFGAGNIRDTLPYRRAYDTWSRGELCRTITQEPVGSRFRDELRNCLLSNAIVGLGWQYGQTDF